MAKRLPLNKAQSILNRAEKLSRKAEVGVRMTNKQSKKRKKK